MNTIMNTAEFIRVTDLLKKEKIAKNSGNIFAAMMAMRENRPEAICADSFKMSIQASEEGQRWELRERRSRVPISVRAIARRIW